jgi:2',3'-cyclic-nucleotide 2'-phosphodiesterase (5'-nucleotidase family)
MLGNLITDLIDMAFPDNDFVLINEGGFRTVWFPGVLQYQHFYNMFPFTNRLISFEMSGHELVETLKVLQSGRKSFYPTKKLRQHVRIFSNGTRQLTKVAFSDGSEIELGRNYRGISIDFLLKGGDDFSKVVGSIYTLRKEVWLGEFRESLKPKLMKIGSISQ